jgi:hypothetical protein
VDSGIELTLEDLIADEDVAINPYPFGVCQTDACLHLSRAENAEAQAEKNDHSI